MPRKWKEEEYQYQQEYIKNNILTYEYSKRWEPGDETLYSVLSNESIELWEKYNEFVSENIPNLVLCGKNASYDNFTMGESIEAAMSICDSIIPKSEIEKEQN